MFNLNVQGLTPEKEKAIVALMNEASVAKAAQACGIAESTLYRWLDEPAFRDEYRKRRQQAFNQASALAQRYAVMGVHTMVKIMTDPTTPPFVRLQAAKSICDFARGASSGDSLQERVMKLEYAHDCFEQHGKPVWREADLPRPKNVSTTKPISNGDEPQKPA